MNDRRLIIRMAALACLAIGLIGNGFISNRSEAAERSVPNAAFLQLTFAASATECDSLRKASLQAHANERRSVTAECLQNTTPAAYRRQLSPFVLQLVSTSSPLQAAEDAAMTLTYRALGARVLAKDQENANPQPLGQGKVRFYQMMAFTNPRPQQDVAFNEWYDRQHVPDVLRVPGFISAQRFILIDAKQGERMKLPPYLVLFALKSGDLKVTSDDISTRIRDGRTRMSPAFDSENGVGLFLSP